MRVFTAILFYFFGGVSPSLADVTPISAERAATQLQKTPGIVIVDLRTPEEFKEGHIKGAINIDMQGKGFAAKLGELDRKKTYLMHCRSGGRSSASIPVWNRLFFKEVLHLSTGTLGWQRAGKELVVFKPERVTE